MFKDKKVRYMTKAIQEEVPAAIQLALWGLIDARVEGNAELDYFQIFELSISEDGKEQIVLHRQEVPLWEKKSQFVLSSPQTGSEVNPFTGKIWVLDQQEYQMMLFPSDY